MNDAVTSLDRLLNAQDDFNRDDLDLLEPDERKAVQQREEDRKEVAEMPVWAALDPRGAPLDFLAGYRPGDCWSVIGKLVNLALALHEESFGYRTLDLRTGEIWVCDLMGGDLCCEVVVSVQRNLTFEARLVVDFEYHSTDEGRALTFARWALSSTPHSNAAWGQPRSLEHSRYDRLWRIEISQNHPTMRHLLDWLHCATGSGLRFVPVSGGKMQEMNIDVRARDQRILRAARQVLKDYTIQPTVESELQAHFELSGGDSDYTVSVWKDWSGPPSCSCPDAAHRARDQTGGFCKHIIAVVMKEEELQCQLLDLLL